MFNLVDLIKSFVFRSSLSMMGGDGDGKFFVVEKILLLIIGGS